jgi:glutamate racemase
VQPHDRAGDPRPIGVFDSGVGGLTVLSEIRRRLPGEATVYLGDNARTPYGPRPAAEVREFTLECAHWLLGQGVKLLVIACNTATSRALADVRAASPIPVLGVVRPGAVTAAAATRSGHVGVIATAGTVESGAYPDAIREADPRLIVDQQACPDLVPLVEAGKLEGEEVERTIDSYLGALLGSDPDLDTLLLGCTHYPLLRPLIERRAGPAVAVVDSAFTTALAAEDLLDALAARSGTDPSEPMATGGNRIATTGDVASFTTVAERVFGARLPEVEAAEVAPH